MIQSDLKMHCQYYYTSSSNFYTLQYDLYHKLRLQFDVLLMMVAIDTRNMYSDYSVNKLLHTVASRWILLI